MSREGIIISVRCSTFVCSIYTGSIGMSISAKIMRNLIGSICCKPNLNVI